MEFIDIQLTPEQIDLLFLNLADDLNEFDSLDSRIVDVDEGECAKRVRLTEEEEIDTIIDNTIRIVLQDVMQLARLKKRKTISKKDIEQYFNMLNITLLQ